MNTQTKMALSASIFLLGLTCALSSCENDDNRVASPTPGITYGSPVKVGNGEARSFISYKADGTPDQIGFKFNEGALEGLPNTNTPFILSMPTGNKTAIDHISFDYSVKGHGPEDIYTTPHFDMHFYMMSTKEVDAITLTDPKIDILPQAEYIPKNYVPGPNEPKMGKHWADTTAHEFHGHHFTSTFIYGSYNGKFHFIEPMVSVDYLRTKPNATMDISMPAKMQQNVLYAQKYTVAWEKERREYSVSLNALTLGK